MGRTPQAKPNQHGPREIAPLPTRAFIAALALLLVTGLGFRTIERRLSQTSGMTAVAADVLARFPTQLGNWSGTEVPIDEALRRATDTDALLSRRYERSDSGAIVNMYVACGLRARDLAPHRPEVCYPSAGWTFGGADDLALTLDDGTEVPSRMLRFSRAGFEAGQVSVLNYYIIDGQILPDVSLLRSMAWRTSVNVDYIVQVQIVVRATVLYDMATAEENAEQFARACTRPLLNLLASSRKQTPTANNGNEPGEQEPATP